MVKKNAIGYAAALAYSIITAYSILLIHQITQNIDPILSILFTFIFSVIVFNLLNVHHLPATYKKLQQHTLIFFIMNVSTAVCWITIFYSLKYLNPIFGNAIFMVVTPLITYLLHLFIGHKSASTKKIILGLLVILVTTIIFLEHLKTSTENPYFAIGVILLFISCFAGAIYLLAAQNLHEKCDISPSEILALRFYLLIFSALVIAWQQHSLSGFMHLPFGILIILSFATSIIPLLCLQISINKIGAVKFSMVTPSTIVIIFFINMLIDRTATIPIMTFMLFLVLTILLIFYNVVE